MQVNILFHYLMARLGFFGGRVTFRWDLGENDWKIRVKKSLDHQHVVLSHVPQPRNILCFHSRFHSMAEQ